MNKFRGTGTFTIRRIILTVLIFIACLSLFTGCKGQSKDTSNAAENPVPVEVLTAGYGQSAGEIIVTGTLEPLNLTQVGTKEGGIVRAVYVEVGDWVKKGQPLAALDSSDFALGVQQAEAAYQTALISFETAEKDFQRLTNLHEEGSISPSDFDKAQLGHKAAKHGLEQAEAALGLARNRLNNATVRAPYDGQITMRIVNLGNYVDAMTHPVLFSMVDISRLRALLKLSEMRAGLLAPGDEIRIYLPSLHRNIAAKIDVITSSVDPIGHTRTAVAWIDNSGEDKIPGGIFFEARILPESLKGKLLLPSTSVRVEADGKTVVYIVQNGKTVQKSVNGKYLADHSEFIVEKGLNQGEKVVLESSVVRGDQAVSILESAEKTVSTTGEEKK